ncbi:hypothetical protein [Ascidiimonas sp. W6]|uniref:hypothetical protein n=1 Tax=Ascidiimonas meishanensis TaxID=3128903 RepID=UPI0030ED270F
METLIQIQEEEVKEVINGNGKCQVNGCSCVSFQDVSGKWPKCARCGHPFSEHF